MKRIAYFTATLFLSLVLSFGFFNSTAQAYWSGNYSNPTQLNYTQPAYYYNYTPQQQYYSYPVSYPVYYPVQYPVYYPQYYYQPTYYYQQSYPQYNYAGGYYY